MSGLYGWVMVWHWELLNIAIKLSIYISLNRKYGSMAKSHKS